VCCVVVVAQKGLGVAPDRVAVCEPNVLTFPTRSKMSLSDRTGAYFERASALGFKCST
jgi:hypothetical protein